MTEEEVRQLQDENASLKKKVEELREEMLRLISRNLDLSERLEYDVELRRRTEVAREIMAINLERQRNADLRDDGQLMALIEMFVEKDRPYHGTTDTTLPSSDHPPHSRCLYRQPSCTGSPAPASRKAQLYHCCRGGGGWLYQCPYPAKAHSGGNRHESR